MTKNEFEKLYSEISVRVTEKAISNLENNLKKFSNENGKIDSMSLSQCLFVETIKINSILLKETLLEVLEFEE